MTTATVTCIASTCDRRVRYEDTFCQLHKQRISRGTPIDAPVQEKRPGAVCSVDECERASRCRGLCDMHWQRLQANGDPEATQVGERGAGHVRPSSGYRTVYRPGHPLAKTDGKVLEHRAVLFDAIGPGAHMCHWCLAVITWDAPYPTRRALVGDHLNFQRSDNRPENLVPCCVSCSARRNQHVKAAFVAAHAITVKENQS